MGKKSTDEIDESTDFFKCLYGMRTDIDWMYKFIELLEGQSIDKQNNQSRDFAISYVITFLKKYCDSYDDCEFVLAVYGFLKGFEYDQYKSGRRIMMYWEYVRKYRTHEFIKNWDRDSVSPSLRRQHKKIIGYLDTKIEKMKSEEIKSKKIKSGDDYKLGLIDEVPKELKFPELREIGESPNNPSSTETDGPIIEHTISEEDKERTETGDFSGQTREEPPGQLPDPSGTNPKTYIRIPKRFVISAIIGGIVFVILIIVLVIVIYRHVVTPPQIKEIDVKTEISVNPGKREDLELDIKPDRADQRELDYKIGNEELVGITNNWWIIGLDGLGDKDSDDTVIVIWGGEAEPAIVNVTVEKPGSRGK